MGMQNEMLFNILFKHDKGCLKRSKTTEYPQVGTNWDVGRNVINFKFGIIHHYLI